jgi:hypothetical protein
MTRWARRPQAHDSPDRAGPKVVKRPTVVLAVAFVAWLLALEFQRFAAARRKVADAARR